MRIKIQFLISIVTFSIILAIIGVSIAVTQEQIAKLNSQRSMAENIQTGASYLNFISNNYFLYQDNSSISLWQAKFAALSDEIKALNSTDPYRQALVGNVSTDLEHLNTMFDGVITFLVNAPRNVSVRVLPSFQTQWSGMAEQIQGLADDSQQLSQAVSDQTNHANQTNVVLIVAFLGLFGSYFIISYLMTYRGTLKSISKLQEGIHALGSGNFDLTINAGSQDEIADISKSVNRMAVNLKSVTASKADLEREMSERKKAERDVLEQKVRAERYLNVVGSIILALDVQGKITLLNRKGYKVLGYEEGTLDGKDWVDTCLPPEIRADSRKIHDEWVKGEIATPEHYENAIVTKNDEKRLVSWHNSEVRDENGRIIGTLSSGEDVTERKTLEEQTILLLGNAQEERDRLSSLLNSINDEVWFANLEKKFVLANPSAVKEFKLNSTDQVIDVESLAATSEVYRSDGTLRPVDEAPPLRALKGEYLKNQEEIVRTPASGELRYRQVSSAPVRNKDGKIIGSVSVVRDITDLKRLQNRLQQYTVDLERTVEERTMQLKDAERLAGIGATAGMVGHDIRNPLQAITSDVYLVKSDLEFVPDGEAKEGIMDSLVGIEKNVEYINKIVLDLQDYARPLRPVVKEVNLRDLCENVLFKADLPKNVKITCRVDEAASDMMADPDLMRRVLSNLVSNAVQAMPEGGKISIRGHRREGDVVVEVHDTGVGIAEAVKPKLFTPLFTTKSKGQGFGLAVVKRVVEAMNGTVTFESQVGKGTTFVVRLPQES
jgi:PAS domain S-box-containing protein